MVALTCPWCETDAAVDPAALEEGFTCPECLTHIRIVEVAAALDLAA